jgi:hypothetical protein
LNPKGSIAKENNAANAEVLPMSSIIARLSFKYALFFSMPVCGKEEKQTESKRNQID